MKLVSFSVENYRSITTARKIPLSDYSLLIGANNEGKSNILHALALGMDALISWHRQVRRTADGRVMRVPSTILGRPYSHTQYDWRVDFPISKQHKANDLSKTNITLEFQLNESEVSSFQEEIKSNLNGTLPILFSFGQRDFDVSVQKPGRGYATLNKKSTRIADFVSRRIRFEYIPAIRTADSANRVISQLVERELRSLEENPEYSQALNKIDQLQKPLFDELATTIQQTVSNFLPSVKTVRLEARREARQRAMRREVEILVDDGQETKLERKGDGVQSLVALALMRHASEQSYLGSSTVVAIEEPESHLHPNAVHELRTVIEDLSKNNQIVLSSHSPLFVNMNNLQNTIIVKGSKAKCADHVSDIREALGVRFADNLHNASVVIIVEGYDDARALRAILPTYSDAIKNALDQGEVTIDYLGGASGLSHKASFYKASACQVQCFIDNDNEGRLAVERAISARSLKVSEVNLCAVPHLTESELEDIYNKDIYGSSFLTEFGVDPKSRPKGRPKLKWSQVAERQFREAGKPWNESIKCQVKSWLSEYAANNPKTIIRKELDAPLVNFVDSLVSKFMGK
ncbi:MAG: AAA family ATPase [Tistlia sp.]|uniref:ATP-dependent endonuclease n=1 Tax=Tistlia sp. TaxID=3057121 RepID=UPI0034A383B5